MIIYRCHFRSVPVFLVLFVDCDHHKCCPHSLDHIFQPLADDLQSMTYQTFEQDPVKYANYEEAIFRALLEWPKTDDSMYVLFFFSVEISLPLTRSEVFCV